MKAEYEQQLGSMAATADVARDIDVSASKPLSHETQVDDTPMDAPADPAGVLEGDADGWDASGWDEGDEWE